MIVGKTPGDMDRISGIAVQQDNRVITGVATAEEAISLFQRSVFNVVLFSESLEETESRKLQKLFRFQEPDVILFQLSADDDPELRIQAAIRAKEEQQKPVCTFKDDILRDAAFHIRIS